MVLSLILLFTGLAGMSFSFVWIIRKGSNNRLTRLFGVCQISIILWLISQLLIIFSVTLWQKRISYTTGNLGISFLAPFWLMFSAEYTGISGRKLFRIIPLISVSSVAVVMTDNIFHLYYSVFEADRVEYAAGFYIYQVIYYVCIISAMLLMFVRKKYITQSGLLILSAGVPLAVNTLTVTGAINARIELTPLFFAFSSIMILIAIGRYGLLDVNSVAMKDVIDNLNTGVVIYTPDGRISYRNNFIEENFSGTDFPDVPEVCIDDKYFSIQRSHCSDNGKRIAEIITVSDVTEYHRLSIEKERSRIAQEIHDSAGHTFTMISSAARILEAEIRTGTNDNSRMLEYIRELDGLARSGITQLRCSVRNLREENFMTSVTQAVRTVADSLRGGVELCIQGEDTGEYNFCIREVYENTREAITNSVRAGAERIDIIIKFSNQHLELYILDNGRGCAEISEHNGLSGIRSRTEKIGGSVKFSSVCGEGFSVIIKIPARSDIL